MPGWDPGRSPVGCLGLVAISQAGSRGTRRDGPELLNPLLPEFRNGPWKGGGHPGQEGTFPFLDGPGSPLCAPESHCTELTGSGYCVPFHVTCFDWFLAPSSLSQVTSPLPP